MNSDKPEFDLAYLPLPIVSSDFVVAFNTPLTPEEIEAGRLRREREREKEELEQRRYAIGRAIVEETIERLINEGVLPRVPYQIQFGDEIE